MCVAHINSIIWTIYRQHENFGRDDWHFGSNFDAARGHPHSLLAESIGRIGNTETITHIDAIVGKCRGAGAHRFHACRSGQTKSIDWHANEGTFNISQSYIVWPFWSFISIYSASDILTCRHSRKWLRMSWKSFERASVWERKLLALTLYARYVVKFITRMYASEWQRHLFTIQLQISIRFNNEMQPLVGKYLSACFNNLKDRNNIVRKYYASAIGHLIVLAKVSSDQNHGFGSI